MVKNTVRNVVDGYKVDQQDNIYSNFNFDVKINNDNKNEYTIIINNHMLLEMILLMVRGETIKYSSRKKKEKDKLQNQLEEEIAKLEGRKNIIENSQK